MAYFDKRFPELILTVMSCMSAVNNRKKQQKNSLKEDMFLFSHRIPGAYTSWH